MDTVPDRAQDPDAGAGPASGRGSTAPESASAAEPGAAASPGGSVRYDASQRSRVIRHADAAWPEVDSLRYKDDDRLFQGVTRRLLAAPPHAAFDVRYFELEPGGYTTHERHHHAHAVVCLRGRGQVRIGDEVHDVGFGDVVQIAPGDAHQFLNPSAEPFGFLCVVDRDRDRPVPVIEAEHNEEKRGDAKPPGSR